jgi:hypothetical protein
MSNPKCQARLPCGLIRHTRQCKNPGKVQEDNEWRCFVHSKEGKHKAFNQREDKIDAKTRAMARQHSIWEAEARVIEAEVQEEIDFTESLV